MFPRIYFESVGELPAPRSLPLSDKAFCTRLGPLKVNLADSNQYTDAIKKKPAMTTIVQFIFVLSVGEAVGKKNKQEVPNNQVDDNKANGYDM